jgi:hypothetical protein
MVAVIHSGRSLRQALRYNEQKVELGHALCLEAVHYPKRVEDLTFEQKLSRLQRLAALNEKTKVNSVHISLNFDPSEQLSPDLLKSITAAYMEGIGFGGQPYLVYQHLDAGHPHVHVVTTNIRQNGKRIALHNLGKGLSETTRKTLEQRFGLVSAHSKKQKHQASPVAPVQYGKVDTKQAVARVLEAVLPHYRYTNLEELNAVLKLYGVMADRGNRQSHLYKVRGLYYRVLNAKGQKVGSPIKASAFAGRPTLSFLEQKFSQNKVLRQGKEQRIQAAIDWALLKPQSFFSLVKHLEQEGILTLVDKNRAGEIKDITFIDQQTKCIFNAHELGPAYSTEKLQQRCTETMVQEQHPSQHLSLRERLLQTLAKESTHAPTLSNNVSQTLEKTTHQLLNPIKEDNAVPKQLIKQKKKRKRQSLHL